MALAGYYYVVVTLHMGLKLRWPLVRLGLVVIAGTIPLMSFVAERYVVRHVHAVAGKKRAAASHGAQ